MSGTLRRRRLHRSATLLVVGLAALLVLVACETEPEDEVAEEPADPVDEEEEPEPEDDFPTQDVTLWNAFEPGHTDDLFNQVFADVARDKLDVGVNTESEPQGPALQYGLVDFLETQPDYDQGYHVFAVSWFGSSVRPDLVDVLEGRELEDLQPIASVVEAPFIMATNLDGDLETLEDVEEYARETGELDAVGSSAGSGLHATLLAWADQADLEFSFIPTDGAGESRTVLEGGGADLAMLTYDPGMDERVNVVAQTGAEADAIDVLDAPSTEELGYNLPAGSFRGFGTHPDVPQERIDWWFEFIEEVAAEPQFVEDQEGLEINVRGPEETQDLRQEIRDTFFPVLEEAGLEL